MGEFEGAGVLVTGGTTGLGREVASRFAAEGASVVITGRDERLGDEAAATLGDAVTFIRADAADPAQVDASVARTLDLTGRLDVLVNNAGVGAVAGVLDTPLETYDMIMDVNVRGAFRYAQQAFPHLERTGGSMVHVSSDAGVMGEVDIAIYSVSKAALIMLSNMLAIEGGRRGVRSNAVCPGDTVPGMRHMAVPGRTERPDDPSSWPVPPVGRLGVAADVAGAVLYLAGPEAAFVNGVALLVDGGMRAGMRTAGDPDGGVD